MPTRLEQYRRSKRIKLASTPASSPAREPSAEPERPSRHTQEHGHTTEASEDEVDTGFTEPASASFDVELDDDEAREAEELGKLLASDKIDDDEDLEQIERLRTTTHTDSLDDDSRLRRDTEAKYAKKKFVPKVYRTKEALMAELEAICDRTVPKIMGGRAKSYYYKLAKELSDSSPRELITQAELLEMKGHSFPMGYFGAKRGALVSQYIAASFRRELDQSTDKVLKFLSADRFVSMVLTCEVLARAAKREFALASLADAYSLLELTCDYGWYIMDYTELS